MLIFSKCVRSLLHKITINHPTKYDNFIKNDFNLHLIHLLCKEVKLFSHLFNRV